MSFTSQSPPLLLLLLLLLLRSVCPTGCHPSAHVFHLPNTTAAATTAQCLSHRVPSIRFRFQVASHGEVNSGFSDRRRLQAHAPDEMIVTPQAKSLLPSGVSDSWRLQAAAAQLPDEAITPRRANDRLARNFSSAHQRRLLGQAPGPNSSNSTSAAGTGTWGYPVQGTVDKASVTQASLSNNSRVWHDLRHQDLPTQPLRSNPCVVAGRRTKTALPCPP